MLERRWTWSLARPPSCLSTQSQVFPAIFILRCSLMAAVSIFDVALITNTPAAAALQTRRRISLRGEKKPGGDLLLRRPALLINHSQHRGWGISPSNALSIITPDWSIYMINWGFDLRDFLEGLPALGSREKKRKGWGEGRQRKGHICTKREKETE